MSEFSIGDRVQVRHGDTKLPENAVGTVIGIEDSIKNRGEQVLRIRFDIPLPGDRMRAPWWFSHRFIKYEEPAPAPQPCPNAEYMTEHACDNAAQCWEPCGQLGKSMEHAAPAPRAAHDKLAASVDAPKANSVAALKAVDIGGVHQKVLDCLRMFPGQAASSNEIEKATGIKAHKRMPELERLGKVVRDGNKKWDGRRVTVWRAT